MRELDQARERHRHGDLGSAIRSYERALGSAPSDVSAWHDYGVALLQARRAVEAVGAFRQALRISPASFDLLLALAQAYQLCGRIDEALACATSATESLPGNPLGWFLRGRLETITGTNAAAEASLRSAVSIAPAMDEAWHYLGECLQRQGAWDAAEQAYRRAMRTQPGEIMNIGICSEQAGRWEAARDAYRQMCALQPERRDCLARLAQVAAMLCDFQTESDATDRLASLLAGNAAAPPDDCPEPFALSYLAIPDSARRTALRHYVRRIEKHAPSPLPSPPAGHGARLRIGYLGADFGRHAVGTLLIGLFAAHDRQGFEVFGYSLKRHDDPIADAIRAEFDVFHDLEGVRFTDVAARIRQDRIDVLIDLGGYTRGSRPEILAMRPAALQLGWLGFIHGQEAPWLDGVILDSHVQPPDADWPYSDAVLRLPGVLFPCGPMPAGIPDRARFDLPENVPLLASFNNSYKLDVELVDAWIEILRRANAAHLAVYLPPQARANFLRAWEERGGECRRLHLLGHLPADVHADRAASCDLFLDAFRYQAGATALACVAAGLPILSRSGDSPLGRLGAGLNHFLGLDDLVCTDTTQYIERAVEFASVPDRLGELRARMERAATERRLFDPRRGAAAIEWLIEGLVGVRPAAGPVPKR